MIEQWANLRLAFRLARRELRSGVRGFAVFFACLFLGVFAISGIGSFSEAARSGLLADAGSLLGGDLEIRLVHRRLEAAQLAALLGYGDLSRIEEMRAMAAPGDREQPSGRPLLVELKAVDDNYPLYGDLILDPPLATDEALMRHNGMFGAAVEDALLTRLGLQVGDQLRVGEAVLEIRARIVREPDRSIRPFTLGPRLLIGSAGLQETGLLQPGSLVTYGYRLRLADSKEAVAVKSELASRFPEAGWRIRTLHEASPRVRMFLDRMQTNLTLLGLSALLVGGLGIAGAVRGYLASRILHIATLKCLGASSRLVLITYLLQVLALGAIGAGTGLGGGAALPFIIDLLLGNRLPLPLQPAIFPGVLGTSALFGLLIALAFSLPSLGRARLTPPSILFRGYTSTGFKAKDRLTLATVAISVLGLITLALLTSSDRRLALWFMAGAGACFVLFRILSRVVIWLASRAPQPRHPSLRIGLGNIHRRGAPAASALFSLGIGLTALVTIALVQSNLDDLVNETVPAEAPAFFFLDIQPAQAIPFEAEVRRHDPGARIVRFPTLRGRITAIAGVPVEQATIDPQVQWAVRGDRFLSYASKMPKGTKLTAGVWWPDHYSGPPKVSLTADIAAGFGVKIGDRLTINLLGREIVAEIASLREVDWSSLQLNFAILFAPGTLEGAPQTHIAAVYLAPGKEQAVYSATTRAFANISAIDTREVLQNVATTVDRIGTAFRAMAMVALLTGFLVLAGTLSADQHRRIRDAVIFKVCGATRRDIVLAFGCEFLLLGLAAGTISTVTGGIAAYGITHGIMQSSFTLDPAVMLLTISGGIALTVLLGLSGTWKALGQKPSIFLRRE